jgi:hypothetical protein
MKKLDSSPSVEFTTALKVSQINKDSKLSSKSKKKHNYPSIKDFFEGSSNKIAINKAKNHEGNIKEKSYQDFSDYLQNKSDDIVLVKRFDKNQIQDTILKKRIGNKELGNVDNIIVKDIKNFEAKKSNHINLHQSTNSLKNKLAAKNALLFGDVSPKNDINQSVINIDDNDISVNNHCEINSNKERSITSEKQNSEGKKCSTENMIFKDCKKRLNSDSRELECSDKILHDAKRQKLDHEVTVNKSPASIKIHRKTFNILKPIVMKYYVSSYIPNAAKFKTIFRKIHMDILDKQIYGMIIVTQLLLCL